ncbi:hypothetical protein P7C73_g3692, partial [Tremellales sp. Uapishka_1]
MKQDEQPVPTPIDGEVGEDETESSPESYSTLSSPFKYFLFLTCFVVAPVGAGVFFYGGGKERVRRWRLGKGYEKMEMGRA